MTFGIMKKWPSVILGALCSGLLACSLQQIAAVSVSTPPTSRAAQVLSHYSAATWLAFYIFPVALWCLVAASLILQLQFGSFHFPDWKRNCDAAYLLIILAKLGLIRRVPTFVSYSIRRVHRNIFTLLEEIGAIELVPTQEAALFSCVEIGGEQITENMENMSAGDCDSSNMDRSENILEATRLENSTSPIKKQKKAIYYSDHSFEDVAGLLTADVKSSLIKERGIPSEEQVLMQLLLVATGCAEQGITCGSGDFDATAVGEGATAQDTFASVGPAGLSISTGIFAAAACMAVAYLGSFMVFAGMHGDLLLEVVGVALLVLSPNTGVLLKGEWGGWEKGGVGRGGEGKRE